MFLTVDVAEWSSVWNWTLITSALTEPFPEPAADVIPGYLITMSTYTTSNSIFLERLRLATKTVPYWALVVGLDAWHSDPAAMNETQIRYRVSALAGSGVCLVGFWQAPVPTFWAAQLAYLFQFCGSPNPALPSNT